MGDMKMTIILRGKFDDYEITQANIRHNNNDYQFKLTNVQIQAM